MQRTFSILRPIFSLELRKFAPYGRSLASIFRQHKPIVLSHVSLSIGIVNGKNHGHA